MKVQKKLFKESFEGIPYEQFEREMVSLGMVVQDIKHILRSKLDGTVGIVDGHNGTEFKGELRTYGTTKDAKFFEVYLKLREQGKTTGLYSFAVFLTEKGELNWIATIAGIELGPFYTKSEMVIALKKDFRYLVTP